MILKIELTSKRSHGIMRMILLPSIVITIYLGFPEAVHSAEDVIDGNDILTSNAGHTAIPMWGRSLCR
jgi:hypothetical protein